MASNLKVDIVKPTATNGSLSLKGDSGGSATANGISIDSSGNTSITGTTTTSTASLDGAVVINESGADVDFRIESDTNANALFVEGSSGNVGIGTGSPTVISGTGTTLDVVGDTGAFVRVERTNLTNPSVGKFTASNGSIEIGSETSSAFIFNTNNTEQMRIDSSGNVGIGVSSGIADKLHIDGNIRLTAGSGINFSAYATSGNPSSNLLDDYEEGTWTPSVQGSSTAGTYQLSTDTGRYTKIGNTVVAQIDIVFDSPITGGGLGNFEIHGWPFSPTSDNNYQATAFYAIQSTRTGTTFIRLRSSGIALFYSFDNGGARSVESISRAAANGSINATVVYQAT